MLRFLSLAVVALAIAGCSQLGGISENDEAQRLWRSRQEAMRLVDNWNIYARAAITVESGAYNISLRWERDARRYMMLLDAPFGQGVFRIDADAADAADRYRLRLPDGQVYDNSTPEALLEEVIGWSLPISGLEYWIRGVPRPGSEYTRRIYQDGRARSIGQDRWVIDYLDYFSDTLEAPLPRRIKLARDELTLKLVIERWQLPAAEQTPSDLFPEFN